MISSLLETMFDGFVEEQTKIHERSLERQQEAINMYNKAIKYPRKTKKAMRKRAIKDYEFWVTIDKWHQSLYKL